MLATLSDSFMTASRMDGFSYTGPARGRTRPGARNFLAALLALLLPAR